MPNLESQIAFYESLGPVEKNIVNTICYSYENSNQTSYSKLYPYTDSIPAQYKFVEMLKRCTNEEILYFSKRHNSRIVDFDFAVYIFPKLGEFKKIFTEYSRYSYISYYSYYNFYEIVRNILYSINFTPELLSKYSRYMLSNESKEFATLFYSLFEHDDYLEKLHLFDQEVYDYLLNLSLTDKTDTNFPKVKFIEFLYKILHHDSKDAVNLSIEKYIYGNGIYIEFDDIVNQNLIEKSLFIRAIHHLHKNEFAESQQLFALAMKDAFGSKSREKVSISLLYTILQLVVYSHLEDEVQQAFYAQFVKNKKNVSHIKLLVSFVAKSFFGFSDKAEKEGQEEMFWRSFFPNESQFETTAYICYAFLAEFSIPQKHREFIKNSIISSFEAGNTLLAYEAAYVYHQNFKLDSLFQLEIKSFTENIGYEPFLSKLYRKEEWQKQLNNLLKILPTTKEDGVVQNVKNERILYEVNLKNMQISPIMQVKTKSGQWSIGRNINLKRFAACEYEIMNEVDKKVAAKTSTDYWESQIDAEALLDLIGYPLVYIANTQIPLELVLSKPNFIINQTAEGYTIQSDLNNVKEAFFLRKETNTRYKVYKLDATEFQLVKSIGDSKLFVPEHGKSMLDKFLNSLSKVANIHSNLQGEFQPQNSISVEPDSKLRVQLLPIGERIQAEIFAKPFGTIPPYVKPGKGGKTLITSSNDGQMVVIRDLQLEKENEYKLYSLIQQIDSVTIKDDIISFEDPYDSLELLEILNSQHEICIVEWPEGVKFKLTKTLSIQNLSLNVKSKNNWFEVEGEIKLDEDKVISVQSFLLMLKNGHNRFVELREGEFLSLSKQLKKVLSELYDFTTPEKNNLTLSTFAAAAVGDIFSEVENLKTDKKWKELQKNISNSVRIEPKVSKNLQTELRPYQTDGFKWMCRLASWNAGACLADDMGLGKTIQTLAVLLDRINNGAALVVCPVSVINNWISEINKFAPSLNCKVLALVNREDTLNNLDKGDVLITSYGLLQSEEQLFTEMEFDTIVLDEAHTIKNFNTKTSKAAMKLKANFRLALTGTPVQNHLGEIWNLFNFINPGLLGTQQNFIDRFVKPSGDEAKTKLKKLISPFILRRTKSAVLDELPPKTEILCKIQLSEAEMTFYEALRRQAIINLENSDEDAGAKHLQALAEITKLRLASCNPSLVNPEFNPDSSKMAALLDIVEELKENGHKALIFSQFVKHLSLVKKAFDKKSIEYLYLDGSTSLKNRDLLVKDFQTGNTEIFLISLKAGGLGLNLTAADYVIHLDPWWNPAIEDQASDRAHRIGQHRPVNVYRLVAENTIEEKIIQLHNSKRDMAELLLEGTDTTGKLSFKELIELIKSQD